MEKKPSLWCNAEPNVIADIERMKKAVLENTGLQPAERLLFTIESQNNLIRAVMTLEWEREKLIELFRHQQNYLAAYRMGLRPTGITIDRIAELKKELGL